MIKDRIILITLVLSVWALIATVWLKPSNSFAHADGHMHNSFEVLGVAEEVHSHSLSHLDIYDFEEAAQDAVNGCRVDNGTIMC